MAWLATAWGASPSSSVASGCEGYEVQRGTDYAGADIADGGLLVADETACCAACERHRLCNAFTFVIADDRCWLKRRRHSFVNEQEPGTLVSGHRILLKQSAWRLRGSAAQSTRSSGTLRLGQQAEARRAGGGTPGMDADRGSSEGLRRAQQRVGDVLLAAAAPMWRHVQRTAGSAPILLWRAEPSGDWLDAESSGRDKAPGAFWKAANLFSHALGEAEGQPAGQALVSRSVLAELVGGRARPTLDYKFVPRGTPAPLVADGREKAVLFQRPLTAGLAAKVPMEGELPLSTDQFGLPTRGPLSSLRLWAAQACSLNESSPGVLRYRVQLLPKAALWPSCGAPHLGSSHLRSGGRGRGAAFSRGRDAPPSDSNEHRCLRFLATARLPERCKLPNHQTSHLTSPSAFSSRGHPLFGVLWVSWPAA